GEVATIQYVTAPADLDWWQQDTAPPLITSGINESGVVAMTLYRKFISFKVADETLLPDMLYELLITEWASLIGQHVSDVDPNFYALVAQTDEQPGSGFIDGVDRHC